MLYTYERGQQGEGASCTHIPGGPDGPEADDDADDDVDDIDDGVPVEANVGPDGNSGLPPVVLCAGPT